ncbi:hypothetical protein RCL1_007782 [Eukaryota sp. TZLM3-RCL]
MTTVYTQPLLKTNDRHAVEHFLDAFDLFKVVTPNVKLSNCISKTLLEVIQLYSPKTNPNYENKNEEEETDSENELRSYLESRLQYTFEEARAAFQGLKFTLKEQDIIGAVSAHMEKFQRIKSRCHDKLGDNFLLNQFVKSLQPVELVENLMIKIQAESITNFSMLLEELIKELEAIVKARKYLKPKMVESDSNKKTKWCTECKMSNHNTNDCGIFIRQKRSKRCNHCKVETHNDSECWKQHPHLRPNRSSRPINKVQYNSFSNSKENSTDCSFLKIPCLLNDKQVTGIIDSAAQVSCISNNLAINYNLQIDSSPKQYSTADQLVSKSLGTATGTLSLSLAGPASEVSMETQFLILPGNDQLLIGVDLLRRLGLMTDDSLFIKLLSTNSNDDSDDEELTQRLELPQIATVLNECIQRGATTMTEISIELDNENQRTELCNLLNNFPEVFDPHFPEQGILCEPMNIDLEDDEKNIYFKARPMNPRRLKIANQIFDELIQSGIARESTQKKYQSPVVLIEYATKKPRLTGDYSGVDGINQNTKPVPANLPKLSEINGLLSSASFIATVDLPRAFYQLMVNPKDVPKTAVGIPGRSIEFLRASFGLRNVPAIFQNTMQSIFNHPSGRVFTYIDDIIIAADTFQEYLDLIEFVLAQAQKYSVRIAAPKSKFCTSNFPIKLVGNIYHKQTRSIDPDRLKAIVELPPLQMCPRLEVSWVQSILLATTYPT